MKEFSKTLIFILLGAIAAYLLGRYVAPILAPFILALFLTFFMEPLVVLFQKKLRFPRIAAVAVTMLIVFGGTGLVIIAIVTRLIVELVFLTTFLPDYIDNIKSVVLSLRSMAESYYLALPQEVTEFISEKVTGADYSLDSILGRAEKVTSTVLNALMNLISSVPTFILLIIIAGIATYFMAKDKRILIGFWLKLIPAPYGNKILEVVKDIFQAVISYIRAILVLITLTFLQTLIGLHLIGAPYALIMALIIGVADIIPVLGPSTIYLPWIIWEFATGDISFAVKLTILYGVVIIIRQVLETKIVSSSIGLHPLATLISMYVGLQLMGTAGVIAGPLFIIALKAFGSAGLLRWKS
ncbi:sporulation integral membrane protein YtvI [Phosphitispora sp. TUW77]|uniref:sporulation integral membrane protein YtvI n=1 Tax=Phosphitispora sp. TUW77 TaxID=3152361 RepID=UPI003AB74434